MLRVTSGPQNEVRLADLGPLRVSEPSFSRRIRVHQAWYRLAILGVADHGMTRPPRERPLGSILPDDASSGRMNFHSPASSMLFDRRRSEGWGIDPVRTLAYLTSSQAMTLNVIGPLVASPQWLCAVLNVVLPAQAPLTSIESVSVEYFSPNPSRALGDRTTIDVLIHALRGEIPVVIAIETKLGDRFNSRRVTVGSAYAQVSHLWISSDTPSRHHTSQLARIHALAEYVTRDTYGSVAEPSHLLVLHHQDDPQVSAVATAYEVALADPSTFHSASLHRFLEAMRTTAPAEHDSLIDSLQLRYATLVPSDEVWQEFLETFPSRRTRR